MKPRLTPSSGEIVVVTAADEGYAVPLAVTIRSALDSLGASRRMRLFILDGGIAEQSKRRLVESWDDPRLTIDWLQPDLWQIHDLPVSDHVSLTAYARLLMPGLLPSDVTRVIYLDSDMLVRRDLGNLWDEPQGDHPLLAVQEFAAPYVDSKLGLPTFERCRQHLAAQIPIPNYRELGLPGDAKYFNSGLLVIDLVQWRRAGIAASVLDVLRKHRQHVLWWDQYALNVVLAGRWRPLDQLWNQGAHIFVYPKWEESPFDRETFELLRSSPWIVHFCSPTKPWQYFCRHPYTRDFRRCLRQTAWENWHPARPPKFLRQWWNFHYRPRRKEWKAKLRAAGQSIREKFRKAA
jgi:lipopolysaccharide biosynthesis glycosyltransferase